MSLTVGTRVRMNKGYPKMLYWDKKGEIARILDGFNGRKLYKVRLDEDPTWNVLAYANEFNPIT